MKSLKVGLESGYMSQFRRAIDDREEQRSAFGRRDAEEKIFGLSAVLPGGRGKDPRSHAVAHVQADLPPPSPLYHA